jgi:hypothetical protein
LRLSRVSPGEGRTSQPQERDPTFEVHHQGHHKGLDGDFGQSPVAGLAQAVELFALGELSLDLGAFPPGFTRPSGARVTGVQTGSHAQGHQVGAVGFTVIGLVPGQFPSLGLGQLGQDHPVGDVPRGGRGLDDELGVGILDHTEIFVKKYYP